MPEVDVYRLTRSLHLLRLKDRETRFFEGLWEIPEGVTYNSYVLTGSEGAVVFDTWKGKWSGVFLEALRGIVDPRDVKYLVVHHMEPDHSGALRQLVGEADPIVLGHPLAKGMIESFYGLTPRFKPIGDGERVVLGDVDLVFHHTPWLHWPETIMTYVAGEGALLSCDAFGTFGVFNEVWADELGEAGWERYMWYMKKYFANVVGTYHEWVVKNIEKLSSRGVAPSLILPSHGLLLRGSRLQHAVEKYLAWGRGLPEQGKTLLVYTSMYGFVERIVEVVRDYFASKGRRLVVAGFTDGGRVDLSDVIGEAYDAESIVFATATYEADVHPLMKHVASVIARKTPGGRKTAVIAIYGWGGRAGRVMEELLRNAGFNVVGVVEFKAGEEGRNRDKIMGLLESL